MDGSIVDRIVLEQELNRTLNVTIARLIEQNAALQEENGFKFCPHCGKPLVEIKYSEDEDDDI